VAYYLDTSAFLKLVVAEPETPALRQWLVGQRAELVGSELVRVETLRAARRHSLAALAEARTRLGLLVVWGVTAAVCERAADLSPSRLRTLDAVHLATALELGSALQGMITYDARLAEACAHHGVPVFAP
jgi:predicted nucleic acid-binding protein